MAKTWTMKCASCGHSWETKTNWKKAPLQCPKCNLFSFCFPCECCDSLTFMPSRSKKCWKCKHPTMKPMYSTAGFFGHLFSPKCPSCGNKKNVFASAERLLARKNDLVTDEFLGDLYPRELFCYTTGYFCCKCGWVWSAKRYDQRIKN